MSELPVARAVRLKKVKPMAPPFHRHIARSKLMNQPCQKGDRVVVYEVTETDPDGAVLVTDETIMHFE